MNCCGNSNLLSLKYNLLGVEHFFGGLIMMDDISYIGLGKYLGWELILKQNRIRKMVVNYLKTTRSSQIIPQIRYVIIEENWRMPDAQTSA